MLGRSVSEPEGSASSKGCQSPAETYLCAPTWSAVNTDHGKYSSDHCPHWQVLGCGGGGGGKLSP